jgi:hypothetical protein
MDDEFLDHLRGQGKLAYHRVKEHQMVVAHLGCTAATTFFLQCYFRAFDKASKGELEDLVRSQSFDDYATAEAEIIGPAHRMLFTLNQEYYSMEQFKAGFVRCEDALREAMVRGYGGSIQYSIFRTLEDADYFRKTGEYKNVGGAHVLGYVTDPYSKHKLVLFDPLQQKGIKDFNDPDGVLIAAERSYEQGTFRKIDPIKDKWTESALIDLLSPYNFMLVVLECITSCGVVQDRSGDPLPDPSFYTAKGRRLIEFGKPKAKKVQLDDVELVNVEWIKEYRESPKEISKSIAHIPKSRPFNNKKLNPWPEEEVKKYKELQKDLREEREDGPVVMKRKRQLQQEPTIKEVPIEPEAKKARVRKLVKYSDKPLHPLEVGRGRGSGPSPFSPLGEQVANYALSEDDIRKVVGDIPIYRYPALDNMKSPDEMFKGHKAAVLLFLTDDKDTGHWLTVLDHPDHYEVFDSFGVGA